VDFLFSFFYCYRSCCLICKIRNYWLSPFRASLRHGQVGSKYVALHGHSEPNHWYLNILMTIARPRNARKCQKYYPGWTKTPFQLRNIKIFLGGACSPSQAHTPDIVPRARAGYSRLCLHFAELQHQYHPLLK